jgi:hypothetical protein
VIISSCWAVAANKFSRYYHPSNEEQPKEHMQDSGSFYHSKLNDVTGPQIWYSLHLLSLLDELLVQNLRHQKIQGNSA